MKLQRNISHRKDQDETPEQLSELEIAKKRIQTNNTKDDPRYQKKKKKTETRVKKMQKLFNKDLEELKKKQTEINNTIIEMKNTLEGINSRKTEAEE